MPQLLGMAVWGILDAFGQQKPREFIEKNRMNLEKMEMLIELTKIWGLFNHPNQLFEIICLRQPPFRGLSDANSWIPSMMVPPMSGQIVISSGKQTRQWNNYIAQF